MHAHWNNAPVEQKHVHKRTLYVFQCVGNHVPTVDVKEFGFMEVVPQDSMTIEEGDEEGEDGEEKGGEERDGSEEKVGGVDADGQHGSGAAMVTAAVETVSIDAMANGTHGTAEQQFVVMAARWCSVLW